MSASSSAIDSALWFREPATKPLEALKPTFGIVILIQTEGETSPRKICQQTGDPKCNWINPAICVLLAGCCAITLFFAFQAPFRLRANENQTSTVKFRTEIAALPARLGAQTMSRFRAHAAGRGGGYDKEVVSNCVDDSATKRRPARERLLQHKQVRVSIQSGPFSERK
jgi:hypothetical protein